MDPVIVSTGRSSARRQLWCTSFALQVQIKDSWSAFSRSEIGGNCTALFRTFKARLNTKGRRLGNSRSLPSEKHRPTEISGNQCAGYAPESTTCKTASLPRATAAHLEVPLCFSPEQHSSPSATAKITKGSETLRPTSFLATLTNALGSDRTHVFDPERSETAYPNGKEAGVDTPSQYFSFDNRRVGVLSAIWEIGGDLSRERSTR